MYPHKSRNIFTLPRQVAVIIAAAASMLLSCTLAQKVLTSSTAMGSTVPGNPVSKQRPRQRASFLPPPRRT